MSHVAPMHTLCGWMGHSSMETTRAYYLGSDERNAHTARQAMDALWNREVCAQFARKAESGQVGAA